MENKLRLTDLVDVATLQRIQDAFSKMTGIAAITTDENGRPVTEGSNFSDFCTNYTRSSELGCARCEKCDREGAARALKRGRAITYFCHAGLVDFAAPIMANDEMVGCFIGGQVLVGEPDEAYVRKIAAELYVDPDEYVEAAQKVTIVPKERIESAADFLYTIASVISNITYSNYLALKAKREIEKAANMKSDFLANMSHEIRTPMNAVIGMAEMALREELPDAAREYINEIKASGKSLLTIINDILDFSKIESGKMDIVPGEYEPMSIVNDVTNIVMARLEDKDVEFCLNIAPNIPNKLYGDCDRIKQIILNLTNNAVKFTHSGQVVLHLGFVWKGDSDIILIGAVEDTGIGIKQSDLSRLFESFQQLDSKRNRNIEGTGLGLAICKQLLTLMDGTIRVESEYEKGSTFYFEIPQKVIDTKPGISVKEGRRIVAAGLISNPYVKKQLEISVVRLGAEYVDLQEEEELASLYEKEAAYLLIESPCLTQRVCDFIETHPQITTVLITDAKEKTGRDIKNLRIVKKPIYTLNLAMIFNNEDIHYDYFEQNMETFDFIAPEAEVLIVDDNAINLTVAEGLLEPLKMKIDTAISGKEAVEKISEKMYDIVFMDHMMPEIDGVETTHIIRRFHKEYDAVPIIALTANAVGGTMEMFLKEGMNDFVPKPIEVRMLVSKVKRWLPTEKIQKMRVAESETASQTTNKLPKIGDLDVESAFRLLGTEKLFWSVLRDYYRVIEQKASHIRKMVKAENWTAYTIEVHALKSASKQIGAHELSEKAARLEKAGNEGDLEFIRSNTEAMLKQYCDYIPVLKPFFEETKKEDKEKPPVSNEVLKQFFSKLRAAMEELDIDTMEEIYARMEEYGYDGIQETLLGKLREAVENIDVDACESIISRWEKVFHG